jgi:hypothetical protein
MSELYGRKFKLTIILNPNYNEEVINALNFLDIAPSLDAIVIEQNSLEQNALRVTFDVDYPGLQGWYYSEITIYNFNVSSLMQVIDDGAAVTLEAGYINGNYGEIFSGYIFQSLFERENTTDYKLTLRCVDGQRLFSEEFTAFSLDRGRNNQVAHFNAIHAYSQQAIPIGNVPSQLRTTNMDRGVTVFTSPANGLADLLRNYSIDQTSDGCFFTKKGVTKYFDMNDPVKEPAIVISPTGDGGLIGTPIQTKYGCSFTCLLNAQIELDVPRVQVTLDMSQIRAVKAAQGVLLAPLDYDNTYQVIGVRHVGDTRGNEWYTYVTGINKEGAQALTQTSTAKGL